MNKVWKMPEAAAWLFILINIFGIFLYIRANRMLSRSVFLLVSWHGGFIMKINSKLFNNSFTKAMHILLLFLTIIFCDKNKNPVSHEKEQLNWRDVALQHGMNPDKLQKGFEAAKETEFIHSILIMRYDTLIAEQYYYQDDHYIWLTYSKEHPEEAAWFIRSVTKSITSALIGIAIDKGYITSVNKKMMDFFPEYKSLIKDQRKFDITIKHLLKMMSGFGEHTEYSGDDSTLSWILTLLTLDPGDFGNTFNYTGINCEILSAIITKTTSMSTFDFAKQYLFDPLGISPGTWICNQYGIYHGSAGLKLSPRDLLKIGQLYSSDGVFNGKQIISKAWIEESTRNHQPYTWDESPELKKTGYGYLLWNGYINQYRTYFAWGLCGQMIIVIPALELIIVTTAGCNGGTIDEIYLQELKIIEWINQYVLGSLID
jgi:hypothetical protein